MIIYHNNRCKKSREALALINNKGQTLEIREYLREPLSKKELIKVIQLLGVKPIELIRKTESVYREQYKGKDLSDDQWIDAMIQFPKLMQRPIVVQGDRAVIGRPPEKILDLFS